MKFVFKLSDFLSLNIVVYRYSIVFGVNLSLVVSLVGVDWCIFMWVLWVVFGFVCDWFVVVMKEDLM